METIEQTRMGNAFSISFLQPAHSAMLACEAYYRQFPIERLQMAEDVQRYAQNLGLIATIEGKYQTPALGGNQGLTYTKLTKLSLPAEVEFCNGVVSDLIEFQFEGYSQKSVAGVRKVVGELHDNVASHSRGTAFSCAQVHNYSGVRHLRFCIADGGVGLLENAKKAQPEFNTHKDAIDWSLKRGNTSARRNVNPMAQRLPEDSIWNPYPPSVELRITEDHHAGEGLWQLHELVKSLGGSLEILTGDCLWEWKTERPKTQNCRFTWQGLVISFDLVIPASDEASFASNEKLEDLARRLGL